MNIVLIGYMASGKSRIGKKLAEILSYSFFDLDDVIEKAEGKTVHDIFSDSGELYFRKMEKEQLELLLDKNDNCIISLGGGTPCYFNTMENLKVNNDLKTVYLNVSIPVLVNRLKNEKSKRPLIAHIESDNLLSEFIGKHLFERMPYYNQAEVKINADGTPESIVEEVVLKLF